MIDNRIHQKPKSLYIDELDVLIAVRENTRGPRKTETALPNGQIKEETKYV